MIITNLKINNMYGIDSLTLELTYPRKTPSSPTKQYLKKFPKINYKKNVIILGANASGKTSIGRSLCFIQNFLMGHSLSSTNIQFDSNKPFGFNIEFITGDFIFDVFVEISDNELQVESWKIVEISQTDSINSLRNKINEESPFFHYDYNDKNNEELISEIVFQMKSAFLSMKKYQEIQKLIDSELAFYYRYANENKNLSGSLTDTKLSFLENILKAFDPSIKEVRISKDDNEEVLLFLNNGRIERINSEGIIQDDSVLSSGTKEAIGLSMALYQIKMSKYGTFYIDEQFAFAHSDLEKTIFELILKWIDNKDMQVFFTTHNKEMLDIELPAYNYIFTRKYGRNGTIEAILPENEVIHKGRSLKGVVEEDIFSIAPSVESLMEVID